MFGDFGGYFGVEVGTEEGEAEVAVEELPIVAQGEGEGPLYVVLAPVVKKKGHYNMAVHIRKNPSCFVKYTSVKRTLVYFTKYDGFFLTCTATAKCYVLLQSMLIHI